MADDSPEGPDEPDEAEPTEPAQQPTSTSGSGSAPEERGTRQVSFEVRTLAIGALIAVLAAAVVVLGWLYLDARGELAANARQAADDRHAEQVATDYAVAAAQMDYRDLAAWKGRLVAGTSPELGARLGEAAESMEQILTPLRWQSMAKPVAAIVRSSDGGVYVVDSFVSVLTKTTQSPQGLQSTATYSVTLDGNNNWQITDVGGIDAAMGRR